MNHILGSHPYSKGITQSCSTQRQLDQDSRGIADHGQRQPPGQRSDDLHCTSHRHRVGGNHLSDGLGQLGLQRRLCADGVEQLGHPGHGEVHGGSDELGLQLSRELQPVMGEYDGLRPRPAHLGVDQQTVTVESDRPHRIVDRTPGGAELSG